MKPKTMILAVVAVVCGLGAMWMTNRLLAEKQNAVGPEKEVREKVLVAKAKIPAQTVFKDVDKYFEEKEMPVAGIPPKAIRSAEKVIGKRLSRNMGEGEYVFEESLVNPQSDGLGAVLAPGMRAVTISVQASSSVHGFVLPKSHVDVLCTVRNDTGSTTYTILENMEVLAVDNKANRQGPEEQSILGTTVTLSATPEECNLLKMAATTGTLDLSLRGIGDTVATKPKNVTNKVLDSGVKSREANGELTDPATTGPSGGLPNLPAVAQGAAPTTPPPAAPPEPEMDKHTLIMITGASVERVNFTKKKTDNWGTDSINSNSPATNSPAPAAPETKPSQPAAPGVHGAAPAQRNPIGS